MPLGRSFCKALQEGGKDLVVQAALPDIDVEDAVRRDANGSGLLGLAELPLFFPSLQRNHRGAVVAVRALVAAGHHPAGAVFLNDHDAAIAAGYTPCNYCLK